MKEKLPIEFITNFVSKGWDEVGNLKATISNIEETFADTDAVVTILQDLVDAYLIALGQMELHLDKKDYLDTTVTTESVNSAEANDGPMDTENHSENLSLNETALEAAEEPIEVEKNEPKTDSEDRDCNKIELSVELPDYDIETEQEGNTIEIKLEPKDNNKSNLELPKEEFDYFVDFDDAELTAEDANNIKQFRMGM